MKPQALFHFVVNGCIYIPLKSVTPAPDCNVSDYTTLSDNHTIIVSNGLCVSNCGILKNLCITAKVSVERSDDKIIRFLIGDAGLGLPARVSTDLAVRNQGKANENFRLAEPPFGAVAA